VIQALRGGGVVCGSARFAALELRGRGRTERYELRDSGARVVLRHGTRDIALLNEIFGGTGGLASCYEPPSEVARMLSARTAPRIIDLGANIGLFGLFALDRWPTATLTAYEPDPANARVLEQTIASNGLETCWTVVPAAVSNADGLMSFVCGAFSESRIAGADEHGMIDVRTVDLFNTDTDVDLLKMDIEGGEWAILEDPRLGSVAADAIVLEWHTRNGPGSDGGVVAARLLREAGYTRTWSPEDDASGDGVVWAWR
jgi:FkbM family methyltransferase